MGAGASRNGGGAARSNDNGGVGSNPSEEEDVLIENEPLLPPWIARGHRLYRDAVGFISALAGSSEIVSTVAGELATGLEVMVEVDQDEGNQPAVQSQQAPLAIIFPMELNDQHANLMPPVVIARALWVIALATLILVIATALYKPAGGLIFGRYKAVYYMALAVIFVCGVAECFVAYWISRARNPNQRSFSCGRAVLSASVGPFVAIMGIGAYGIAKLQD